MNNSNIEIDKYSPLISPDNSATNIIREFNDSIQALGETRNTLEREIIDLRDEFEILKKEKSLLEIDLGQSKEVYEIAIAANASEQEKFDALKKNQELRSYLDSASEKIKSLDMKITEESNNSRRLQTRINELESEKINLVKERDQLQSKILGLNDLITEQDYKVKSLNLQLETAQDSKESTEKELISTKKALDEIQNSMDLIKNKMRKLESV